MKRLDKFVEVLFLRKGDKLVLTSGSAAYVVGPGSARQPVMQRALSTAHIVSAIAELMPEYLSATFSGTESEEFEYEAPAGKVHVQFAPAGDGVLAELRRAADAVPAWPAGAIEIPPPEPQEPGEVLEIVDTFQRPEAKPRGRPPAPASRPEPALHAVSAASRAPARAATTRDGSGPPTLAVGKGPTDPAAAMLQLLELCSSKGASDLHLTSGRAPALRIDGDVRPLQGWGEPSAEELEEILWTITPERNREQWTTTKDADFAYEAGDARFRVNLFCDRSGIAAVMRRIPGKVFNAEEMGIPKELLDLCFLPKGLILVTGPTGSGKSTTLAAMLDHVNRSRDDNIITIEDPIEFVHVPKRCQIHQREVGVHTQGFKAALRAALREDPDVVLIGEMRDLETVSIALETAETGHLVFGTLHTNTAPSTVDRIIDQFPADRQSQIRMMLSESLKAVVTQTLCKKVGGGRVAAREVLLANSAVSNLIREGKTFQLASTMQTGRGQGMVTLNDALLDLVRKKLVLPEEALSKSVSKAELRKALDASGLKLAEAEA
ncbi:MAG TPA: type IV pilus twitching motility protein PilT [Myxococcales bacterium]|nr:type IV pilus twitching motility protein PilT [Myxococcales bacterium]